MKNLLTIKNILLFIIFFTVSFFIYKFNHKIFFLINGFQKEIFQYPMYLLTTLVDGFIILMIAIAVYPFNRGLFFKAMLGFVFTAIIIQVLKFSFSCPRPPAVFTENLFVMGHAFKTNSFPSGHSGTSLFFAGYFIHQLKSKWLITSIIFVAILSAISRVYIGVHFPIDIWVGGWIGFLSAKLFLSYSFYIPRIKSTSFIVRVKDIIDKYSVVIVNILGVVTALLYLFYYKEKPEMFNFFLDPLIIILIIFFLIRILLEVRIVLKKEKKG